ncbi:MAG TPA: hypothetical protein VIO94_13535, partial [Phenylobacterium sp.]
VADPARAKSLLGWTPRCSSIEQIVRDAARWHSNPRFGRPASAEPAGQVKDQPQSSSIDEGDRIGARSAV